MAKNIAALFNQFAGKEVQFIEQQVIYEVGDKLFPINDCRPVPNEPIIAAMEKVARDNDLVLQLSYLSLSAPCKTEDVNPNRVNVQIKKDADGKYRVSSSFGIG